MIFSDGAFAFSALHIAKDPSNKGIAILASEILFYNLTMISGVKYASGRLTVDSQGRVRAGYGNDVLLRKRA